MGGGGGFLKKGGGFLKGEPHFLKTGGLSKRGRAFLTVRYPLSFLREGRAFLKEGAEVHVPR